MKCLVLLFLATLGLSAFSSESVEAIQKGFKFACYQADGDDRYDLTFDGINAAIVHTNDNDESELVYYDSARYYSGSETLSAGRYILSIGGFGYDVDLFEVDSSLYKLNGIKKELLSSIMVCNYSSQSADDWLKSFEF